MLRRLLVEKSTSNTNRANKFCCAVYRPQTGVNQGDLAPQNNWNSVSFRMITPNSQSSGQHSRVLMLSSNNGGHTGRSGYSILADYVPGSRTFEVRRFEPRGFLRRAANAVLRSATFTSWYRFSSARLEWRAWRALAGDFHGPLHLLWADQDLGFLDLIARQRGVPLCCTFHCCPDTLGVMFNYPSRLKRIDKIVLMSRVQRSFFEASGVPPERLHVVLHGIDTEFFKPADRPASGPFNALFVGNYRRNFKLLREVCEGLNRPPTIPVRIVTNPDRHKLFAGLGNVTCRSGLSDAELREAYQTAACLFMTCEQATANNALLEGMACGLPVVAESVGGIPEYVGDGNGLLTPVGESAPMIAAIRALAADATLRGNLGSRARQRAVTLDWKKVGRRMQEIYTSMERSPAPNRAGVETNQ